jgi:hypothetical protein
MNLELNVASVLTQLQDNVQQEKYLKKLSTILELWLTIYLFILHNIFKEKRWFCS